MRTRRLDVPNWKRQSDLRKAFWLKIFAGIFLFLIIGFSAVLVWKNLPSEIGLMTSAEGKGSLIIVKAGGNFQAALDRAKSGDTIQLQAGATFKGAFKLPKKAGEEFITIRTSASDSQLPPADTRIDPKKYADVLPKIFSDVKGEPAIYAAGGAHHFRFIGVEFLPTIEGLYNIIQIGSTEETAIEQLPHHIEFDRVYLHGDAKFGQRRGIAANGRFLKIKNSYFSDFKREGEESQAIAMWATNGQYRDYK